MEEVYYKLLGEDRRSLSWGSGGSLLEDYQRWTDAAWAGDVEEVYSMLISWKAY